METNLEPATTAATTTTTTLSNDNYDDDSNCSTPYVSAPSSPGHRPTSNFLSPPRHPSSFFFYSAPTSPMHYVLSSAAAACGGATVRSDASSSESFEFDSSSRVNSPPLAADELFLNGQIRPMKLRAHLSRPDRIDEDITEDEGEGYNRGRDVNKSQGRSRRTRSMSPMRNTTPFDWINQSDDIIPSTKPAINNDTDMKSSSASSSRCSSAGRSSKRWIFLKDFLRSKSEGRSNNKFWQNINMSFSASPKEKEKEKEKEKRKKKVKGRSAHEMHYAANRAQAEEMRKKTYLPYRQGLLGCLGFNSKSYGAFHGFATALSSR